MTQHGPATIRGSLLILKTLGAQLPLGAFFSSVLTISLLLERLQAGGAIGTPMGS